MNTTSIKKYYLKCCNSNVNSVFALYVIFISLFALAYIFVFHKKPDYFLIDDGYYMIGKYFYEGKITLSHQVRGPGMILLFSSFNIFPAYIHPYLRILITLIVTYGNLFFVSKIFENILSKKQLFWGMLLAIFNPLYIHFTIKNTPEVFITFFLGVIIFSYIRFLKTMNIRYIFYSILFVLIGMFFKPVFFLIPLSLLIHNIFINKNKKIFYILIIFSLLSIMSYFSFHLFTKSEEKGSFTYGYPDIMGRIYLFDAIMKTGELNMGTTDDLLRTGNEKSNFLICNEYFEKWLKDYEKEHTNYSELELAYSYIKDNLLRFVFLRVTSPLLFICLTSNTFETVSYLFLYSVLVYMVIVSLKKLYKKNRCEILIIIYTLMGYAMVFFLSLSYARYSIPFMFYFLIFIGVILDKYAERIFGNKEAF
jgi:hypothetical protein